ncbi:hypothetical protein D9758_009231 [Tetrapyrgos nigripes]|uniref:Uncharacterized protein n=1 Tax=Tetrapyrgos nigripes TaxID=182062 RepID=A0A8H5FXA1_9AGAR|nr:hypothetical protein D9758_009231 [Tetrapyrgos nigripes]
MPLSLSNGFYDVRLLRPPTEILQAIILELEKIFTEHLQTPQYHHRAYSLLENHHQHSQFGPRSGQHPILQGACSSPSKGVAMNERTLSKYVRTLRVQDRPSTTGHDNASQEALDEWQGVFMSALSNSVNIYTAGKLQDVVKVGSVNLGLDGFPVSEYPPAIPLDRLHNLHTLAIDARGFHLPSNDFNQHIFKPLSAALKSNPNLQTLRVAAPSTTSTRLLFWDLFASVLNKTRKSPGASTSPLSFMILVIEDLVMFIPVTIAHFQFLTSLEVTLSRLESGKFWNVLCMANVHLERLMVNCDIERTLLDYISQCYSRLRVVRLYSAARRTSDEASNRFFGSILPKFAGSLVSLSIHPNFEGRWCIGQHNLDMVFSCCNMESLAICLSGDLEEIVDVIDDVVNRAHSLLRLRSLPLSTTLSRSSRSPSRRCLGLVEMDPQTVKHLIREALDNLQPTDKQVDTGLCIHSFPLCYTVCRTQDGSLKYEATRKGRGNVDS